MSHNVLVDHVEGTMPELLKALTDLRQNRQIKLWLTKFERRGKTFALVFHYSEVDFN